MGVWRVSPEGRLEAGLRGPAVITAMHWLMAQPAGAALVEDAGDAADAATHLWTGEGFALRSVHPEPALDGAELGGLPPGWPARALFGGVEVWAGPVPASGALTLGDPGLWRVEIAEDWALGPHRPAAWTLEVTA